MFCLAIYRINSCKQTHLSVQKFLKNSVKRRNVICLRDLVTLTKSSDLRCSVTFSHLIIRNEPNNEGRFEALSRKKQCDTCFSVNTCRNYSDRKAEGTKAGTVEECVRKEKLTLSQTLKKLYKEYAYVLVPTHLITSMIWFGSFYYMVASGVDVPALLEKMGLPESWVHAVQHSGGGNVLAAYAMFKIATPLRYTVTIGGTTFIVRYLRKIGLIKPHNNEQLKKIYEEQKDALKDLKNSCQKKMQVTKNDFIKTKKEVKQHFKEAKEEIHKSVKESKEDFKEGVKSAADEWKMIGRSISKPIKDAFTVKK